MKKSIWLVCLALMAGSCLGAAESKRKLTVEAMEAFKKLAPDKITVEKGEEPYLKTYGFAYRKLENAISRLRIGRHAKARYAIDGFLHYMNQLKSYAFKDELEALYKVQEKVNWDLLEASSGDGCKIPMKDILTDQVMALVPDQAVSFKKWVTRCRVDVKLGADIMSYDNNYAQPRLSLYGPGGVTWSDGQFRNSEVLEVRSGLKIGDDQVLRKIWMAGGVVRECKAVLLISQSTKDGDGILKVPFTFMIWREADGKQGYKKLAVDFDKVFVLTKE